MAVALWCAMTAPASQAARVFLVTLERWPGGRTREPGGAVVAALEKSGSQVRPLGRDLWLVRSAEPHAYSIVDALHHAIDVRDRVIVACVDGAEIDGRFSAEDRRWVHAVRAPPVIAEPGSIVA